MKNQIDLTKLMTDSELVTEFKNGNEAAFNALYYKYERQVYIFVFRKCKDSYLSEEVTQITFIKFADNIQTYSEKGLFKSWLYKIAQNELFSTIRKNTTVISSLDEKSVILKLEFFADFDSVEKAIELNEKKDELLSLIKKLPANQCIVISLLLQDMGYKEIAQLANMNINTVKTSRFHGIKNLRKMYVQ